MNRKLVALCVAVLSLSVFLLPKKASVPTANTWNSPQTAVAPSRVQSPSPAPEDLHAWVASFRAAQTPHTTQLIASGVQLAKARHDEMQRLMRANPAEAFARSLSWSEWAALPEDMRAFVERPFSDIADFQVLPSCEPLPGAINQIHPHRLTVKGETYDAFVYGSKASMTSKEGIPVRGIILDNIAVLSDEHFERLQGDDLVAASALFPGGGSDRASWISGKAVGADGRAVLLGGAIYNLATSAEESELADALSTAAKSFHPKSFVMALQAGTAASGTIAFSVDAAKKEALIANSTWTETSKRVLAVRLSYSSAPAAYSFTMTQLTNLLVASSNEVKTISYRKTWLVPSYATVNLPNDQAYYEQNGPNAIVDDTRTQLTAQGISTANYDIVVHAHPQSGGANFGYAGLGVVGGGTTWVNGTVDDRVLTHEIGHNYGLGHAHYWAGLTGMASIGRTGNDGSQVEFEEYGDPFDVMGSAPMPAGHYGAHGKAALNWIEPKEVINVVTNGIYRVYRFDHPDARTNLNTTLALKVTCPSGEEYWVSHRKLFTANASMSRGIYLVRANGNADQVLLDTTPLSKPNQTYGTDRDDAALAVGKSFIDSAGTVRITTIAAGGAAPLEYLDVQVTFTQDNSAFAFFTGSDLKTNGLVGSYVNTDLRTYTTQNDWRTSQTIAGKRIDPKLSFTSDGWGARAPLHLTGGTDANWDNFSVQWDGYIQVRRPVRLATTSDDSSRMWIDLNNNNAFSATAPEFINNHWGTGQGATRGDLSAIIPPGLYRIRIQYEEGNGGNYFAINAVELPFQLFTTSDATTPGLTASFVAKSLRSYTTQNDWRTSQTIVGSRVDSYPVFKANGWGTLTDVGLTTPANGTDANWDAFSVQWDGYISNSVPIRLGTVSDDASRIWIDANTNGVFGTTSPEYFNNGWGGSGQGATIGAISGILQPGLYQIRIQYEDGGGDDSFVLAGVPQQPLDPATLYNGLVFTGVEHWTTSAKAAADLTVEFWIRTIQVTGGETDWRTETVLANATDFGVSLGNGKILFGVKDATIASPFIADGAWHHVTARRIQATGELAIFIDGAPATKGVGITDVLTTPTDVQIGSAADNSRAYIGNLDNIRIWETARTQEQLLADLHLSRSGHLVDTNPEVRIAQFQTNSFQIFWDALSSYRALEGATTVDGTFTRLPTDQNSTNIIFGATPIRFFRVRQ